MDDAPDLMFCSDVRTGKVDQLRVNDAAEACWYFEDSREQFRLSGTLRVADGSCTDARLSKVRSSGVLQLHCTL